MEKAAFRRRFRLSTLILERARLLPEDGVTESYN